MRRIVVRIATTIQLNEQQKSELTSIAQSRSLPAGYVFRAKLILLLNEGATFASIRERLGTTNPSTEDLLRKLRHSIGGGTIGRLGLFIPSKDWVYSRPHQWF